MVVVVVTVPQAACMQELLDDKDDVPDPKVGSKLRLINAPKLRLIK